VVVDVDVDVVEVDVVDVVDVVVDVDVVDVVVVHEPVSTICPPEYLHQFVPFE
jgi:hypothetical protein